jgi:hypothetical protein
MHLEQGCASCEIWEFHSRNMAILTKFLDFAMFGTRDPGHNGKKSKKFAMSINHYICSIFHVENNLSKLQFNFAHFVGPILTLCGPAPLFKYTLRWLTTLRFYFIVFKGISYEAWFHHWKSVTRWKSAGIYKNIGTAQILCV